MKRLIAISSLALALFAYAISLSLTRLSVIPESLRPRSHPGFHDYKLVVAVFDHLRDRAQALESAREAKADVVFLAPLNNFKDAPEVEGWQRRLLVLAGHTYSYLNSRILNIELRRGRHVSSLGEAQTLLADLLSQSGAEADRDLLMLLHPTRPGFSWEGDAPAGLDGVEVMSPRTAAMVAWRDAPISFFWSLILYPIHPELSLVRLMDQNLAEYEMWDRLSMHKSLRGLSGVAGTGGIEIGGVPLPLVPLELQFRLSSTHLLLRSELIGELDGDRAKVFEALTSGEYYMALESLGDPVGFACWAERDDRTIPMGASIKAGSELKIFARLPSRPKVPFEIALLRDGQNVSSINSPEAEFTVTQPGVYRVIVRVFMQLTLFDGGRWIHWIVGNPLRVGTP